MSPESNSIQLALDALAAGNTQKAISILTAIDRFTPETVDRLFIKGNRYFYQHKYTESVIIFVETLL